MGTWNDYGEGTMVEPAFLRDETPGCSHQGRPPATILDCYWHGKAAGEVCEGNKRHPSCVEEKAGLCSGSGTEECTAIQDCSRPWGSVDGPAASECEVLQLTRENGDFSAYSDLAL